MTTNLKVKTETEIHEIARELKIVAVEHPMLVKDMLAVVKRGIGKGREGGPHPHHKRQFSYDGLHIQVAFTLTVLGVRRMFQLSCANMRGEILPEAVVEVLTSSFFPNGKFCEIPSMMHGPRVRQFIQDEQDR